MTTPGTGLPASGQIARQLAGPPSANVTLDVNGNGTAFLGPARVREHWQPVGVSVKVATNVLEATCSVYVGPQVSSANFISQTITGSTGDTCGLGFDIQPGQYIFAVWEGGDPGEIATMAVTGTYTIGSPQ